MNKKEFDDWLKSLKQNLGEPIVTDYAEEGFSTVTYIFDEGGWVRIFQQLTDVMSTKRMMLG